MLTICETLIGLVGLILTVWHDVFSPVLFWHWSNPQMAEVHGNIFTLWLGHTPGVVLHGFQAVKDGLNTHPEEFSGRLETPVFKRLGLQCIMFSSGHTWKQQRRFGLMTLRNLGLGKKGLEHQIQEEARHLVGYFETVKGKSLDPSVPIVHAVSNVICAVVFGHRFSLEDETFHRLIEAFDCILAFGNSFHFLLFELLPWLMHHLPGPQQKANSCCEFVRSFIRKEIRSHKERGIPDKPQDFIDFYLAQIAKVSMLLQCCGFKRKIFLGGFLDLKVNFKDYLKNLCARIQRGIELKKVQKELDTVLGPSQLICYEDRKKLPYANAVIHEIQRYCSIVLIAIPRESGKDTTLQGFPIPKGTLILPNLDSVLFDPEKWESPRQFSPSRFLDKEGNFVNREAFLPFSTGSRVCLGEQLARSELFIFFANLLRAFKFTLPQGGKEISTELVLGSTMQPQPYKLCVVPR
uniref:Cytochrome P450 2J6-like n=1 Tax=Chrysemys picta bellii TaxID=8478 RepID=A0A8C3HQ17_CHRPI